MRERITLILILLIIIPVSGFSFWKETPEDVLIKFLKTFYSNNPNKTYNYVSKADRDAISRKEFIKQNNLDDPFRREMAKLTSSLNKYEINGTRIN